MKVRCWIIYLLLHLAGKVSLQDSANEFNRVVGDSVTLPCIYENQQSSTDVLWLLNGSRIVFNIINGKPSLNDQHEIFRNRTESFPSAYAKGNYSIKLKDLQLNHAGSYICVLKSDDVKRMQLFVKENPKPTQNPKNSCMETESLKIMILLTATLGLTLHLFLRFASSACYIW